MCVYRAASACVRRESVAYSDSALFISLSSFLARSSSLLIFISRRSLIVFFFFFFQAEDGIRDRDVTGVQTCALPISPGRLAAARSPRAWRRTRALPRRRRRRREAARLPGGFAAHCGGRRRFGRDRIRRSGGPASQIGRASGRDRGEWQTGVAAVRRPV